MDWTAYERTADFYANLDSASKYVKICKMYAKYKYMQNRDKLRDILCYEWDFFFFFLVFHRCYKNEINGVIGNLQIFRYNISVAVESLGTCINVFNFSNVY